LRTAARTTRGTDELVCPCGKILQNDCTRHFKVSLFCYVFSILIFILQVCKVRSVVIRLCLHCSLVCTSDEALRSHGSYLYQQIGAANSRSNWSSRRLVRLWLSLGFYYCLVVSLRNKSNCMRHFQGSLFF
jgi:hypothetical protein